jgi:hypothetical protein
MTKLTINTLWPNNNLRFAIEGEAYEEVAVSQSFQIKVPPACPLMSKEEIELTVGRPFDEYGGVGGEFKFSKFSKQPHNRVGYYKLRILLKDAKDRKDLKKGDKVRIFSSSSLLDNLKGTEIGREYTILQSGLSQTGKTWVLDIEVPNFRALGADSGSVDPENSFVREVQPKRILSSFTVKISKDKVFDNLINVKSPVTGTPVKAVRDIPIYAFKNYDKENTAKIPKYLMLNGNKNLTIVDEKTPPAYSTNLLQYANGPSFTNNFYIDSKPNFLFYVAIARYYLRDGKWRGEWLQINKSEKVIWGRATLNGDK